MPAFGESSIAKLNTVAPELRTICERLVQVYDITVVYGHRGRDAQDKLVRMGYSKIPWPTSKHNYDPSLAVDIAPWINGRVIWGDGTGLSSPAANRHEMENAQNRELAEIYLMAGRFLQIAYDLGIKVRWGGDWNRDNHTFDNRFNDLFHFELER